MHVTEFFRDVVCTEAACLEFLRKCGVLVVDNAMSCPGKRDRIDCDEKMKTSWVKPRQRTKIPTFQCRKRRFRRNVTVRSWNHLFHHPLDAQGRLPIKLTLCNIMELLYIFLYSNQGTIDEAVQKTDHGKATVVEWFAHFRETMGKTMGYERRLVGSSANPVQVDESYFRGRREYRRGRLIAGDTTEKKEKSGNDVSERDSSDDENEL